MDSSQPLILQLQNELAEQHQEVLKVTFYFLLCLIISTTRYYCVVCSQIKIELEDFDLF